MQVDGRRGATKNGDEMPAVCLLSLCGLALGDPPESERLCCYYACSPWRTADCLWLRCLYREAFDRLTDHRLPSPGKMIAIIAPPRSPSAPVPPALLLLHLSPAEEQEKDYVPVIPVPITANAAEAYSRPFLTTLMHCSGLGRGWHVARTQVQYTSHVDY
jgi:hypothetical protein